MSGIRTRGLLLAAPAALAVVASYPGPTLAQSAQDQDVQNKMRSMQQRIEELSKELQELQKEQQQQIQEVQKQQQQQSQDLQKATAAANKASEVAVKQQTAFANFMKGFFGDRKSVV